MALTRRAVGGGRFTETTLVNQEAALGGREFRLVTRAASLRHLIPKVHRIDTRCATTRAKPRCWRMMACRRFVFLGLVLGLTGCGPVLTATTSDVAAVAGAGAASAVTKSAAVATGIGLGIAAGAQAGLQYAERVVHRAEQDRIAAAAAPLPPGVVGQWSVSHTVPIEADEHGDLVVIRLIGNDDFACKEIVFSVDTQADHQIRRAFYTATVCRDGTVWKWASAEPATERWGALQ